MKKPELLEFIEKLPDDGRPFAHAIWQRDDVVAWAMEQGIGITDVEADSVIEAMDREHDAEVGLNWNVLDSCLNALVETRKEPSPRRRKVA